MLKTDMDAGFNYLQLFFKFINFAFIIVISIFIYLAFDEINIINNLQNIINTNLNIAHNFIFAETSNKTYDYTTASGLFDKLTQGDLQGQITQTNRAISFMVASTGGSILLLLIIWYFLATNYNSLQKIKKNRPHLQDLLYDSQVKQIHTQLKKTLPATLIKIQQEKSLFVKEVKHALMHEEFILWYQPIIDAENGIITGVEALLRWQHPKFGNLLPDCFLPLCELTECTFAIAEFVIHKACQQIKDWNNLSYIHLSVAINLSARQLNDANLINILTRELTNHSIFPGQLKIEITESMIMENMSEKIKLLKSIKQLGIKLSLDDFGTGFASLNYVKSFPFDTLKIDKTFISDMATNITNTAIIESIITLGKNLGLNVVAEGVENEQQCYMLKKMNCDMFQGYLYSKPLDAEKMTQLLNDEKKKLTHKRNYNDKINCHFEVMTKSHYDQAVALITQTFCEYEPMTKYLNLSQQAFTPFAEIVVKKAIKDGLSIVALNGNQMIGCTIVEDFADSLDINISIDPKFKIIFSLLETLSKDFFNNKSFDKGHIAHLFITAIHKDYFGKGLSRMINLQTMNHAKQKKFDFMYCEFTHTYNEKGTVKYIEYKKLRIRSISYQNFIYEGRKPFEHLEGEANAYIWELHDDARLHYQNTN